MIPYGGRQERHVICMKTTILVYTYIYIHICIPLNGMLTWRSDKSCGDLPFDRAVGIFQGVFRVHTTVYRSSVSRAVLVILLPPPPLSLSSNLSLETPTGACHDFLQNIHHHPFEEKHDDVSGKKQRCCYHPSTSDPLRIVDTQ
jgi:hypothetical protein